MPVPDNRKASEHVAQRLRIEIADGTLQPGDMLPPEADLMAKLGVGRPTLREALRLLESEGLARVQRGNVGGVRIEAPDRGILARYGSLHLAMAGTSLAQVFAARDVLELEAVRLVAKNRDSTTWDVLAATVEEELACGDDGEVYGVLHDRFHSELMAGCGNPALDLMWHTLDEVVGRHRSRFVSSRVGKADLEATNARAAREGRRAHHWLVTLLRARSADEAERAWTRHLESSRTLLLSDDATGGCIDLLD